MMKYSLLKSNLCLAIQVIHLRYFEKEFGYLVYATNDRTSRRSIAVFFKEYKQLSDQVTKFDR